MTVCLACGCSNLYRKIYDHHSVDCRHLAASECNQIVERIVPGHFIFKGTVSICQHCGFGMLDQVPNAEQLSDYYQLQFWKQSGLIGRPNAANDGQISSRHQDRARRQAEFIVPHVDVNRVIHCLEVGAGDALLTIELKRHLRSDCAFDVCEPGESWHEYYQANGIHHVANFFPFEREVAYQLVVASHWLEHVVNPLETLKQIGSFVESGGYIMIEVPNTAHSYWQLPVRDTPHVSFFTCESLRLMGLAAGLQVVDIGEFGITFDQHVKAIQPDYASLGRTEGGYSVTAMFQKI